MVGIARIARWANRAIRRIWGGATMSTLDFIIALLAKLLLGAKMSVILLLISAIIGNLLAVPMALARVFRNPLLWIPSYVFIC